MATPYLSIRIRVTRQELHEVEREQGIQALLQQRGYLIELQENIEKITSWTETDFSLYCVYYCQEVYRKDAGSDPAQNTAA